MIKLPPRYSKIIKKLSGGGMSDTLVCFDANLDREVVVKFLKSGIEKHRLMDELSALADIRSKYVVQVFDVLRDGSEIVGFVEEYIKGAELKPLTTSGSEAVALRTLYSIISGIADIHEFGRVHRDIKPENMKFDEYGVLKIFDFGLAKLSSGAKTKQLFYTPKYTAPEIFAPDENGEYIFTPSVDVFAFGVTALWLVNGGKLPQYLSAIPPLVPPSPAAFDSMPVAFSAGLNLLLNRCLSLDPLNRPSSTEVKAAIGKQLLFNRHRMLITYNGVDHFVDEKNPRVKLTANHDSVTVTYSGMEFSVTQVSGHVRHNNKQVSVGYVLQGSAVIVLGDPATLKGRTSITADISHPEVMN